MPARLPQQVDVDPSYSSWKMKATDKAMAYGPALAGTATTGIGFYIAIDRPLGLGLAIFGGVLTATQTWWGRNVAPRIKKGQ